MLSSREKDVLEDRNKITVNKEKQIKEKILVTFTQISIITKDRVEQIAGHSSLGHKK